MNRGWDPQRLRRALVPASADAARPGNGAGDPLLAGRGITKRYGRRQVLTGADFAVYPGEVVGIAGENGAGKSTLVRILAGLLPPDRGEVSRPHAMGFTPQNPLVYDRLTPWEHFRYSAAARGLSTEVWHARAEALLERYRFQAWRNDPALSLSGGTRQKLNLALALLSDPLVLLLDEPYGGFEWETYLRFWEHVREMQERGRAVVIVSHLFYERERFHRLLTLREGRLWEES